MSEIQHNSEKTRAKKIFFAIIYGLFSFSTSFINHKLFNGHKFPSFLVLLLVQLVVLVAVLSVSRMRKLIEIPRFNYKVFKKVFPLSIFYLGSVICSLKALEQIDMDLFLRMRRFSVFLTLLGEFWILREMPSMSTRFCVVILTGGTLLTISGLSSNTPGYIFMFSTNVFLVLTNIFMKDRSGDPELRNHGTFFYNSLIVCLPLFIFAFLSGDFEKISGFEGWFNGNFIIIILCSCFNNIFLLYGQNYCMYYNSVLSISIIACLKHTILMYFSEKGSDYSYIHCVGFDLCIIGGISYFFIIFNPIVNVENQHPIKKF